jgi:prepilin-type N-terminal cleavage/methylation domain-containing protein
MKNINFNKGFTLIEAVLTIAILAVSITAMVAMLRYSDNSAMQAAIEANAALQFSRQSQYLVNMPMSVFKANLKTEIGGTNILAGGKTITAGTNSTNNPLFSGLLAPITDHNLIPGAVPVTATLNIKAVPDASVAIDSQQPFLITLTLSYNVPTMLNYSNGLISNSLSATYYKW